MGAQCGLWGRHRPCRTPLTSSADMRYKLCEEGDVCECVSESRFKGRLGVDRGRSMNQDAFAHPKQLISFSFLVCVLVCCDPLIMPKKLTKIFLFSPLKSFASFYFDLFLTKTVNLQLQGPLQSGQNMHKPDTRTRLGLVYRPCCQKPAHTLEPCKYSQLLSMLDWFAL